MLLDDGLHSTADVEGGVKRRSMSGASTASAAADVTPPAKNLRLSDGEEVADVGGVNNVEMSENGQSPLEADPDGGGEFEFQGRRKLRLQQRKRAIIFSGQITDFTASSLAAAKLMTGKVTETRFTRNGELVVEVDNDEDASRLSALQSLGGVPVSARQSKPRVLSKGMVYGVHRSIPELVIVESLRKVGVSEAVRVKARDARLGAMVATDRVILTFSEGSSIPEQVCIGLNLHAVVAYYEPLQCYRCNMYGHVSKNCQLQSDACRRCSEPGHLSSTCSKPERCINCGGPHSSKFGSCPVRVQILERWRRSTLPASKTEVPPVPLLTPAPGVNAHETFRLGRSYSGAVRNGLRLSQTAQSATSAPASTDRLPPQAASSAPSPPVDIDALTTQIAARVLESVTASLTTLISDIVAETLAKILPKWMEQILTALRRSPTVAPSTFSAPAFDFDALARGSQASQDDQHPQSKHHGG